MEYIKIQDLKVSKFIIGGNPFSGFSHQGVEKDIEMRRYYSFKKIKEVLKTAEKVGVNTICARSDRHILRVLMEYWDEGGTIQWFAQSHHETGPIECSIENAILGGAKACYIHGGVMDYLYANNKLNEVFPAIEKIKNAGIPVGIAAHNPEVHKWAEKNLNLDFYMCSYYNPISREENSQYKSVSIEYFKQTDRDIMAATIKNLKRPVIHYKVMAAGRNNPEEALFFVSKHMRPQDAVCIGIFNKAKPDMIEENISILQKFML